MTEFSFFYLSQSFTREVASSLFHGLLVILLVYFMKPELFETCFCYFVLIEFSEEIVQYFFCRDVWRFKIFPKTSGSLLETRYYFLVRVYLDCIFEANAQMFLKIVEWAWRKFCSCRHRKLLVLSRYLGLFYLLRFLLYLRWGWLLRLCKELIDVLAGVTFLKVR